MFKDVPKKLCLFIVNYNKELKTSEWMESVGVVMGGGVRR